MDRLLPHTRMFRGWMAIVARFGLVQTLVILSLFYFFLIGPIAIGGTFARVDLLHKRGLREETSAWVISDSAKPDLERAKLST